MPIDIEKKCRQYCDIRKIKEATLLRLLVLKKVPVLHDAKNNRSDSKHGTFRKYGQPPIDTPEETSAIPFKKMKPKNEAYNIPRIEKSDCTIK